MSVKGEISFSTPSHPAGRQLQVETNIQGKNVLKVQKYDQLWGGKNYSTWWNKQ